MQFESARYSPASSLVKSFVEAYRYIKVKERVEGVTLANGRIDAVIVVEGKLEWLDPSEKKYKPIPTMSFFPFTKKGGDIVRVGNGSEVISIKCYPHILTKPVFDKLVFSRITDFQEILDKETCDRLHQSLKLNRSNWAHEIDTFIQEHFIVVESDGAELVAKVTEFVEQQVAEGTSLSQLAKQEGLSIKTLERRFSQYTGLTIKVYRDLVKFQKAAQLVNIEGEYSHGNLLEALGSGYYDQSHFVKVCRRLTGQNPKDIFTNLSGGVTDFVLRPL